MSNRSNLPLLALAAVLGFACSAPQAGPAPKDGFADRAYAEVLGQYVDDRGLVDYNALKANRATLDSFLDSMANLAPDEYEKWGKQQQIAFWINAYNSLTLRAIIDNYPIRSSFFASLRFPKNSIRQISGVWDELRFKVMGRDMTLDQIEHEVLRKQFEEPRIHMALVCAAMSCPPLRNEPYAGDRLDEQLADQSEKFLRRTNNFRVERTAGRKGKVYLSSIFDWFGGDFVGHYPARGFTKSGAEGAVVDFVSRHVPESDREFLKTGDYSIRYTDYDWTLNEP